MIDYDKLAKLVRDYPHGCTDQKNEFLSKVRKEFDIPEPLIQRIVVEVEVDRIPYDNYNVGDWNAILEGLNIAEPWTEHILGAKVIDVLTPHRKELS
jgi:hypothetical protein